MTALDEMQSNMLVAFHSALSCIYLPIILSALYFTDFLYRVGTTSFLPVVGVLAAMECVKRGVGNRCLVRDVVLGAKGDDRQPRKGRSRSRELLRSCGVLLAALASFFVLAVLLGAEAFSRHEETFMLSLLLCVLAVFPVCLNAGPRAVPGALRGARPLPGVLGELLLRNLQCTLLGAWLGAAVIPLDWDRPWQQWPVPCCLGALLGHTASNLLVLAAMVPEIARAGHSSKRAR
ncbi:uncharacterized protein LOC134539718 [Bacillus rossius redtenbacheri]|uniref:uncharacterized protein LOC134539718 n=1 Tax=Bacillus rossius redtenbacheri TaxID=93214 RepID=UPI002FDE956C